MAKAGGSATANGILYQILGTLGRAVDISLRAKASRNDFKAYTLVIEPSAGGDLVLVNPASRIVEQWKSRSNHGAWSLNEVIDEVLPDLYGNITDKVERYRFVTEGRIGTWKRAYLFFRSLGPVPTGNDVAGQLNDTKVRNFAKNVSLTDRQLFLRVVKAVRTRKRARTESLAETYRKVWKLLSCFELKPPLKAGELTRRINRKLTAIVEDIDHVDAKRFELCGRILKMAGRGSVRISPGALLRKAGLSLKSFMDWKSLCDTLSGRLKNRLSLIDIDPKLDVRTRNLAFPSKPVTVITGDGGQGKTWRMASLASAAAKGPSLVVWITSDRGERSVDEIAAAEIWHEGLGKESALSLASIAKRRAKVNPERTLPWATVCADGVLSKREASYLLGLDWEHWGIRLVITAPRDIGRFLASQHPKRVVLITVENFTPPELSKYLEQRGRSWAKTPHDVRELIRRPILARMFVDVAKDLAWAPRYEYELMEANWRRINTGQAQDFGLLRSLAFSILDPAPIYPWSPELLLQNHVTAEAVQRLKDVGWVREIEDGTVEFTHDRLLCWAVAESIANRKRTSELTTEAVVDILKSLNARADKWATRLAYVLLDALWIMTDEQKPGGLGADAWHVLAALETGSGYGAEATNLYGKMLPTLGGRIVPAVIERALRAKDDEHSPYPKLAASTLLSVARQEPQFIKQKLAVCLGHENLRLQEIAIRLLPSLPDASHLDRAWALHRPLAELEGKELAEKFQQRKRTFRAVAACLQHDPQWVERLIGALSMDSPLLAPIIYLLATTHGEFAVQVWSRLKEALFARIPEEHRRCLINCILTFRDRSELERLTSWVKSEEELVGPSALAVLALFDPPRAAASISQVMIDRLFGAQGNLTRILAIFANDDLCREIQRLATERPADADHYLELVTAGDRINSNILSALIDRIDKALGDYLLDPNEKAGRKLGRRLDWLGQLRGRPVLTALLDQRGTTFEERLAEVASRWADNDTGYVNHDFNAAKGVLLRIGGPGLTRVVNALLSAKSRYSQLSGCEAASIRPDDETRTLVADRALGEELWANGSSPFPLVQQKATNALAAMDQHADLVKAVLRWGMLISPDASEIREGRQPMSDDEMRPALLAIADPHSNRRPEAVLAIGLSGRGDLRAQIHELFLTSAPESQMALASMLALEDLGGRDPESNERLVSQYRSRHHKFVAMRLLASGDRQESAQLLTRALPQSPPFDDMDRRIIGYLGAEKDTRNLVQSQLGDLTNNPHLSLLTGIDPIDLLDLDEPDNQEELWESASTPGRRFWERNSKALAIKHLGKSHPPMAFDLAYEAMLRGDDRDDMARILLENDAERAIPLLIDFAVTSYNQECCRSIALELRRRHRDAAASAFAVSLSSDDWHARKVVVYMAAYLGEGILTQELSKLVLTDGQSEVCLNAAWALRQQQREAEAAAMVPLFAAAKTPDEWGLADEIVDLADPTVLSISEYQLGFMPALRSKSFMIWKHFATFLHKQEEKLVKDLSSSFGQWEKHE